jgi:hypothetical protein
MNNIEEKNIEEIVRERLESLPDIIKGSIKTSDWENKIREISKKNNLLLDQAFILERSVFMFILALISLDDLKRTLRTELKINSQGVENIILEIENDVLLPIKQHIVEFMDSEDQESVEEKKPEESLDRESILKEIEKDEENETEIAIPTQPSVPSTQINTAEQNQKIIEQDLKTATPNTVAQKLQTPSVSQPKVVKIDPYRESF